MSRPPLHHRTIDGCKFVGVALNIKNQATEDAVRALAALTGESQVEAVRIAVEERVARISEDDRRARLARRLARVQGVYREAGIVIDQGALYDDRGRPA